MNWPDSVRATVKRLNFVQRSLQDRFISRDRAIQLFVLATICQENVLLVGPPGTAKTAIANRYTELIEARGFYYLLTRFTEPSELFGPLDLQEFEQGSYTIRTEGMLPEAQIVFLDEVFQGSSAILNTLLAILNEHIFYNGSVRQRVPLISLIGATNNLPEDPSLRAFADRFILRLEINPVANNELKDLIELGWDQEQERIEQTAQLIAGETTNEIIPAVKLTDVLELHGRLTEVNLSAVQPIYPELLRELRAEGIELSDRRIVKGLKLVARCGADERCRHSGHSRFMALDASLGPSRTSRSNQANCATTISGSGGQHLAGNSSCSRNFRRPR